MRPLSSCRRGDVADFASAAADRQATGATQTDLAEIRGFRRRTADRWSHHGSIGGFDRQAASTTQTDLAGVRRPAGDGIGLREKWHWKLLY
jgi:hypothetical protein